MTLEIKYKTGNQQIINFKSIEFADEYVKEQAHNISWYRIIEG